MSLFKSLLIYLTHLKIPGLPRRFAPRNDEKSGVIASVAWRSRKQPSSFSMSLVVVALGISGCGFEPLHQHHTPDNSSSQHLPFTLQIMGSNEDAYSTYKLKQELMPLLQKVAFPSDKKLRIKVNLSETYGDIGFGADASVLRSQGRMAASLAIYDQSIEPIYTANLDAVSSYTINESEEFSNLNAKNAVKERLIINLANDLAREIALAVRK